MGSGPEGRWEEKKSHSPSVPKGQTFLEKAVCSQGGAGPWAEGWEGAGPREGCSHWGWALGDRHSGAQGSSRPNIKGPKQAGEGESWRGGTMQRADIGG